MNEHGIDSWKINVWTWAVLVVLTGVNIGSSFLRLGAFNPTINFTIAFAKAALVMIVFMRLRQAARLTLLVAVAGYFWLGILILLSLSDFLARLKLPGTW